MGGEVQTIEATRWGRKIPDSAEEVEARRRRRDGDVRENRRNWGRNAANSARRLTVVGEEVELQIAGVNLGDGEATQRVHWPTTAILFPSASPSHSLRFISSYQLGSKITYLPSIRLDSVRNLGLTDQSESIGAQKLKQWLVNYSISLYRFKELKLCTIS